ncbi:hypothetical protein KNN17_21135 [Arthrobacter bambusae]|uniref:hypothetical protein n=1 Tax=Arthrobacter bambusae TaxID=1338426 RepID=UPI001F506BFB|nr:hypothetical protein [Arthrobacter bambusae]MCI0144063.1 hypothetical protein [Arthrobacter bambusae]
MTTKAADSASKLTLDEQLGGTTWAVAFILRLICLLPFAILATVATITSVNKESWERLWTIVMLVGIMAAYSAAFAALIVVFRGDPR